MVRGVARLAVLAACLAVPGCASMTSGVEQTIAVTTAPAVNASCTLRNANGSWRVASTPGTVTVRRAYGDLAVACALADGASGQATMSSGIAPATYANILLMGSVVWAAVDAASGAAFAYPDEITVPLKVAAIPVPVPPPAGAVTAKADDPQSRLQQLQQQRAEYRISFMEYQARLADLAAAGAIAAPVAAASPVAAAPRAVAAVPVAATSLAVGTAAPTDDARSRLQELQRLRAEHSISFMEYQMRLADLIERGGLPADAATER
jgi:hypothetical protein